MARDVLQRLHRRNQATDGEEGIALVSVIGFTFILTLVVIAAVGYAVGAMPQARRHQDWNAALAAAEAGIDDYLYHLNADSSYWTTAHADNEALGGWKAVPGGISEAEYTYGVDAAATVATGVVTITSTGRVGDQTRTVQARLRREGFLDYIYFTDYETVDPLVIAGASTDPSFPVLDHHCSRQVHQEWTDSQTFSVPRYTGWSGGPSGTATVGPMGNRVGRTTLSEFISDLDGNGESYDNAVYTAYRNELSCGTIRFVDEDVIEGPLRTNDAMLIDAEPAPSGSPGRPQYLGQVTTAFPGCAATYSPECNGIPNGQLWLEQSPVNASPYFRDGIKSDSQLALPETNSSIDAQADGALGGCRYFGPTYIHLKNDRMNVVSPLTPTSGANAPPASCLGMNRPLPSNGVISVRNSSTTPASHPLGMPRSGDAGPQSQYPRYAGDVFIWGTLDGQLSVAAQNNIFIVWDTTYADGFGPSSDDLLGLIATENVMIYHPVNSSGNNLAVAGPGLPPFADGESPSGSMWRDPEIHAAILALNHSFMVQNYSRGNAFDGPGEDLSIRGAIAQRYRGAVGTGGTSISTGYIKDYVYDDRLQWLTPPHFIAPAESPWLRRFWSEIPTPAGLPS